MSAGVQYRFSEVSAKESVTMGRKGSHILDDGTLAVPNPKPNPKPNPMPNPMPNPFSNPRPSRSKAAIPEEEHAAGFIAAYGRRLRGELGQALTLTLPNPNPNPP